MALPTDSPVTATTELSRNGNSTVTRKTDLLTKVGNKSGHPTCCVEAALSFRSLARKALPDNGGFEEKNIRQKLIKC